MLGRPLPAAATAVLLRQSMAHQQAAAARSVDQSWDSIVQARAGGAEARQRDVDTTH
jgi:hypothetical protein